MTPSVEFFDARALRLAEVAIPTLSPEERQAMDRFWDESVAIQPALFDGPAVACIEVDASGGELVLEWARVTYRYRALRSVKTCAWLPASVFVTVLQPVEDGALIVGRSSATTSYPGRWALPGGSAEPPAPGETLDLAGLRRHAAQELVEEIGVAADPEGMTVWAVTRGEHGNIGVHFRAPTVPLALVLKHHEALVEEERARGTGPELDQLAAVRSVDDLTALGTCADFLPQVIARYAAHQVNYLA